VGFEKTMEEIEDALPIWLFERIVNDVGEDAALAGLLGIGGV
jgi:hypothetical protein